MGGEGSLKGGRGYQKEYVAEKGGKDGGLKKIGNCEFKKGGYRMPGLKR